MKTTFIHPLLLLLAGTGISSKLTAQLTVSAQVRTRSELRDGQGAPLSKNANPAFFTSQRSRLNVGYSGYRFKTGLSFQDTRVWGQDVSTINRTTTADNNGLLLHEAWAEIMLTDTIVKKKTLSLKLGRQELVYDDQRLIGNLDWLQQARSHDAALLKFESKALTVHLAGAFNQNKENAAGTVYNSTPAGNYSANTNAGSMYKSMEFLYAGHQLKNGNISFLFFSDQFSKYRMDTINNAVSKTFQAGSWTRATTGIFFTNSFGKLSTTASAYYQFGKTYTSQKLSALLLSAYGQWSFNKKLSVGAGIDYISGGTTTTTSNSFDPLYGTPHKFWGLMDYYYAASAFGKGGLTDYYLKSKFKASGKLLLAADLHQFSSAAKVPVAGSGQNAKKSFGQEVDMVASYALTKVITIETGYSHYFSTTLLASPSVKNISNARNSANWAYLMINIKPELLFK